MTGPRIQHSRGPRQAAARRCRGRRLAGVAIGLAAVYGISAFLKQSGRRRPVRPAVATAEPGGAAGARRGRRRGGGTAGRCVCPTSRSGMRGGSERHLAGLARAAPCFLTFGQPGACPAARRCRRSTRCRPELGGPQFEVVSDQHRHPRSRQAAVAGSRRSASHASAYYADPSAKVFQDLKLVGSAIRHADHACWSIRPVVRSAPSRARPRWASEDALKLVHAALGQ